MRYCVLAVRPRQVSETNASVFTKISSFLDIGFSGKMWISGIEEDCQTDHCRDGTDCPKNRQLSVDGYGEYPKHVDIQHSNAKSLSLEAKAPFG